MIYAASDLHGNLPDVPEDAEALLLVGDICPDFMGRYHTVLGGTDNGAGMQANWLNCEFREWLDGFKPVPVYAIWGNHDFVGEHHDLVPGLRWDLLEDGGTTLKVESGEYLRLWGTPWVPGLPRWAFYGSDNLLGARAQAIPEGIDILMAHGPPYYAGDYIPTSPKQRNKYGNYGGDHVGDHHLNLAIRRARPRVTVCGHIHEARGRHWLSGLPVINVAAVDERYNLHEDPWTPIVL